jgi:hypothetical protein
MTMQSVAGELQGRQKPPEAIPPGLMVVRENRELASELKFQIPASLAERICEWARCWLSPDPNADAETGDSYHLSSLYFDTEQLDVFRRNGSFGRTKYRIRRYGPSPMAYLERKLKTNGLVCKRRSPVSLKELERLAQAEAAPGWVGFWYHQRLLLRQLRPECQIAYHRVARTGLNGHGPFRLTVDQGIRALPAPGLSFADSRGGQLVSDGYAIVELKYRNEMPVVFKQLVEQFALNPKRISKYRLAIVGLGIASEPGTVDAG